MKRRFAADRRGLGPFLLAPLAVLLLAGSCLAAASLVPEADRMSDFQARLELARLYGQDPSGADRAEDLLRELAAEAPGDIGVRREQALLLVRQKRFAEARAAFENLLAAAPESAGLREGYGDALMASGAMPEAAEQYRRALSLAPSPALSRKLARVLLWGGRPDQALPLLRDWLARDPDDREPALLLAQALLRLERRAEAEDLVRTLAARFPDDPAVLSQAADLETGLGHAARARELTGRVLALSPKDPALLLAAGDRMNLWGDFSGAAAAYRAARALRPEDPRPALKTARALAAAQRFEEAEGVLTGLLMDDPAAAGPRLELARTRLAARDTDAALAALDALPAGTPEAAGLRAEILLKARRFAEAEAAARPLADGPDASADDLLALGKALAGLGRTQQARSVFLRAAALDPKSPEARYALMEPGDLPVLAGQLAEENASPGDLDRFARLLAADGRVAEAEACLDLALDRDPDYFPARMDLAELLAADRRFPEALAVLDELDRRAPGSPKSMLVRARTLAWSRDYRAALDQYARLRRLDPTDPVPVREAARTAYWAKLPEEGRAAYADLARGGVDQELSRTLAADPALAAASRDLPPPGDFGCGAYEALAGRAKVLDPAFPSAKPDRLTRTLAELAPAWRIRKKAALEGEAKDLLWNRRYAKALDRYRELAALEPGNEEALFDQAQAECSLGLCDREAATYERLLAADSRHTLAEEALTRQKIRTSPALRAAYSFWQEDGHGDLSGIARQKADLEIRATAAGSLTLSLAENYWLESPMRWGSDAEAHGQTLGLEGPVNEYLRLEASFTRKDYTRKGLPDRDSGRLRLEFNLDDAARLGIGAERMDEIYNSFGMRRGVQSDQFFADFKATPLRPLEIKAKARFKQYSDANTGHQENLDLGWAFTDHPRILRLLVSGEHRDTQRGGVFRYDGGTLTDIVHPYWTPKAYWSAYGAIQWVEDLSREFFCGAEAHTLDVKAGGGTDTEDNPGVRVEAEWRLDFAERWSASVSGMVHRSPKWDAEGAWISLLYRF